MPPETPAPSEAKIRLDAPTRRDQILRCATEVFAKGSYRMTAVADIARHAGISEPTVYKHFASKKELFLTILDKVGTGLLRSWQEAAAKEPDPIALLRGLGLAQYETALARPETLRIQFQALSEVEDEEIQATLRRNFAGYLEFLGHQIERAKGLGVIARDVDAVATAWQFLSIGFTFNLTSLLGFEQVVTREKVEVMGNQLLKALGSTTPGPTPSPRPATAGAPPKRNGKVRS